MEMRPPSTSANLGNPPWWRVFGAMLAHERNSESVEVADVLGGIYIASWERIQRYWPEGTSVEDLMLEQCGLDAPRWFYWIRMYDHFYARRSDTFLPRLGRFWMRVSRGRRAGSNYVPPGFRQISSELQTIYDSAARISGQPESSKFGGGPAVSPVQILLAVAEQSRLPIAEKLRQSGLDIGALKAAVKGG